MNESLTSPPVAAETGPAGTPQPAVPPALPFLRRPGETPRAFSAFLAFFNLGHTRSLPALADHLGEKRDALKRWSSQHRWSDRIQAFNAGLLQEQAAACRQQAGDWARRTRDWREQEWQAAQQLRAAAQCFLESFGDHDVERMTLAQVSRALQIASQMARQAMRGTAGAEETAPAPLPAELAAALRQAYGPPPPDAPAAETPPSQLAP